MPKRIWTQSKRDPKAGRWAAIYATLNPKGVFHISRLTFEMLGEPEAIHIWFDKLNNVIGLKPTRLAMDDAYPIKNKNKHHGKLIRGFAFVEEFSIRLHETVRFPTAEIDDDGILVLDLRKAVSAAKLRRVVRTKNPPPDSQANEQQA